MPIVEAHEPDYYSRSDWVGFQELALQSLLHGGVQGRTLEEIRTYISADDFERFYAAHLDQNTEVGISRNPNQEYDEHRIVTVEEDGEIVTFVYGALVNVSGDSEEERAKKRSSIFQVRNHVYLGEGYTLPGYRNRGYGGAALAEFLGGVEARRDVRAYSYAETPDAQRHLTGVGFKSIETRPNQHPFGSNSRPTEMTVMRARFVGSVRRNLRLKSRG